MTAGLPRLPDHPDQGEVHDRKEGEHQPLGIRASSREDEGPKRGSQGLSDQAWTRQTANHTALSPSHFWGPYR